MLQTVIAIVAFVVALGILVSIHEFGHYWVARRLGVRVLRYSLGFGYRIVRWTSPRTGIEYCLSAIPLGGYVKMLDEREQAVADKDKPYAFNQAHPWRRIAIVAAGPLINILFAVAAFWLVLMLGIPGIKPVVDAPVADSPAAAAGFQARDRVSAMAGQSVTSWQDLHFILLEQGLDGTRVPVTVNRPNGSERQLELDMSGLSSEPDRMLEQIGLRVYQPPATPHIGRVLPHSPASDAALKSGDEVLSVGGDTVDSPQALVSAIQSHPDETVALQIRRDGKTRVVHVALSSQKNAQGRTIGRLGAAVAADPKALESMRTVKRLGPVAAVPAALARTWQLSDMSLRLLGRMITGQVSWHNIGGPVQIASYAGQSAQIGLVAFVSFLAFISINLALINLLPIPVLDGGHLLYYAIEWVRGRPLSEAVQAVGQQIGLAALLMLMILAFYNDILRLLG